MKTITEFSGIVLQRAAEAQRSYRAAHPQAPAPVAEDEPQNAAADAAPAEASSTDAPIAEEGASATSESTAEATGSEAAEAQPASDEPAPASEEGGEAASAEPAEPVDLGTGPEAESVGEALQVSGDRLSRLMEALDVVGRRVGQVRLVRVIQGESPPQGAQQRGDFYYVVDLTPRPQSQQRDESDGRDGDRRRGPGGRDRGGRPGSRGPGGPRGAGGPPGKGGKFSNDRAGSRDASFREARGEVPRAGAGWMLTRAPEDKRLRSDEPGADRRDRRPPRGPRFDGPRPPMGARGDRPPRGPRPTGGGGRPPFGGPRAEGDANRAQASSRPEGRGPGGGGRRGPGPGPRRPEGAGPRREDHGRPMRRRGGWDEPAVPEPSPEPSTVTAVPAAAEEMTAQAENRPAPVVESTASTPVSSESAPENAAPPSSTSEN
jgi:hypothetical protein